MEMTQFQVPVASKRCGHLENILPVQIVQRGR